MKKNLMIGVLLSAALIYLSVRGVDPQQVLQGLKDVKPLPVLLFLCLTFVMQVLRAWRWGVILNPLEPVRPLTLFGVSNVGFLAIVALPARLGELVRPYLITEKSGIPMTAALGTILVERAFDGLTVLLLSVGVFFWIPLPPWLIRSGALFAGLTAALFAILIYLTFRQEKAMGLINPLIGRLPARYAPKARGMVLHFIEGLRVMADVKRFTGVALLSGLIWLVDVLAIYCMFLAVSLHLPPSAAFVVMIILLAGIAIPTAPGFIGNWHYACVLGLSLYGIEKGEALSFAIIYHFLSLLLIILLGAASLPFNRISLSNLKNPFAPDPA